MTMYVTNTLGNLCTEALALLNVIDDEASVPADDMNRASKQLQLMLKSWQAQDVLIWMRGRVSFVTGSGTAGYDLSTNLISTDEVVGAVILESGETTEVPLTIISRQQYLALGDKTTSGRPVYLWPQHTSSDEDVTLWPVPDAVYTIKVDFRTRFTDQDERTDAIEIPGYWMEAVSWCLAERLLVPYGKAGTPTAEHIIARSVDLYANAAVHDIRQDGGGVVQFIPEY